MRKLISITVPLVAAAMFAAMNTASAATAKQCEARATNCLGKCAGIDSANSAYGRCIDKCDGARTACLDSATSAASKGLTVNPGPAKPPKTSIPTTTGLSPSGIKPGTSSPPKAGVVPAATTSPTMAPAR